MFCITYTTVQEYLRRAVLSFVGIALLVTAVPYISPVFASGEQEGAPTVESAFPVSDDRAPLRTITVVATAYSSDPYQTDATPCIPAMNFDLCTQYEELGVEDTIAANFLPLGTQVKFPDLYGDKVFVVRDRMNARYNGQNRIDFWVGSEHPTSKEIIATAKSKARGFGVKKVKMEIYSK
jgi:3D (Asp-Asp-Asp) domain-containing protein